jgi:hypothetical protein
MTTIPNIIHFCFGLREQTEPFLLVYYLAVMSAKIVNNPDKIYMYYHYEPFGPLWELLKPHIILEKVELPTMIRDKPIIFRSLVPSLKANGTMQLSSEGVRDLMLNLSRIVDTKDAVSSNPADTFEALIGPGKEDDLNRAARAALSAAAIAAGEDVSVLDAFVLGEPELLDAVAEGKTLESLLLNAVAFGYTSAVGVLLKREPSAQVLAKAVYTAADCARTGALKLLLKERAATNFSGEVSHPQGPTNSRASTNIYQSVISERIDTSAHLEQEGNQRCCRDTPR